MVQQVQENELVKEEMELLEGNAKIYKQVGPALIPQSKEDACENVASRIRLLSSTVKTKEKEMTDYKNKLRST